MGVGLSCLGLPAGNAQLNGLVQLLGGRLPDDRADPVKVLLVEVLLEDHQVLVQVLHNQHSGPLSPY